MLSWCSCTKEIHALEVAAFQQYEGVASSNKPVPIPESDQRIGCWFLQGNMVLHSADADSGLHR